MPRTFPRDYSDPYGYRNGDQVLGAIDQQMSGAELWEYAHARRNVLAIPLNATPVLSLAGWAPVRLCGIPVPNAMPGPSLPITIQILYKTSSTTAGDEVYCVSASNAAMALSSTYVWAEVSIAYLTGVLELSFRCAAGGTNTMTIACVCAYQAERDEPPGWTELNGATCKVGVADFPYSAHMLDKVTDNVSHVRWRRLPRYNLMTHWFGEYARFKSAPADPGYGDGNAGLGHYRVLKPAGVDTIYVDTCLDMDATVRATLRTEVSASVEDFQTTTDLDPDASGDALWMTHTYTFAGANIAAEMEITIKIDALVQAGGYYGWVYIPGVCVRPKHIETAITHELPNVPDFAPGRDIGSANLDDCRDTLHALYKRIGLQHLMSDWRWTVSTTSQAMTPLQATEDKGDHGSTASTIARAIMFASQGTQRVRVSVGFRINDDATAHDVSLIFRLGDSMTDATNDAAGPTADPYWWVVDGLTYAAWQPPTQVREIVYDLEIADQAADVEIPSGALTFAGTVPHQIWIQSKAEAATAHLVPYWVVITEPVLMQDDLDPA